MTNFDSKANQDVGLQGLLSQKDLDTVFGTKNVRGSAMRPPVHSIPTDSIFKFKEVLSSELGCDGDGSITITLLGKEVVAVINHPDDKLVVYGHSEG